MTDLAVISNSRAAFSVTVMMVMTGGWITGAVVSNRFQTYANIPLIDVKKAVLPG
jgi:hypothetical protein